MTSRTKPAGPLSSSTSKLPDTPEVDAAEKKVGAVLDELEHDTGGEVEDIGLDDLVDTDANGRPVLKKAVDIDMHQKPARTWQR